MGGDVRERLAARAGSFLLAADERRRLERRARQLRQAPAARRLAGGSQLFDRADAGRDLQFSHLCRRRRRRRHRAAGTQRFAGRGLGARCRIRPLPIRDDISGRQHARRLSQSAGAARSQCEGRQLSAGGQRRRTAARRRIPTACCSSPTKTPRWISRLPTVPPARAVTSW